MTESNLQPKLLGFGLANYRSFGETGFVVDDIKKVNFFIGKNNSGKSNVLRAISVLRKVNPAAQPVKEISPLDDHHRRNPNPPSVTVLIDSDSFLQPVDGQTGTRQLSHFRRQIGDAVRVRWKLNDAIRIDGPHPFDCFSIDELDTLFRTLTARHFRYRQTSKEPYFKEFDAGLIGLACRALFQLERFLFVPVFREIGTSPRASTPEDFNGQGIIERLRGMQHPKRGEEHQRRTFDKIEHFLRGLLGTELSLEIPDGNNELIVNMHGNRLSLESYGTGIHHLVILCSALALHEGHTVLIEEPEIHLHPDLQRRFLRFIAEQTSNTYHITTHSNVFLDARPDVNVYHVQFDGTQSTMTHLKTTARSREVLSDMGYKASDLLQSNCIIWVEGPSDRIYLNKWLSLIAPDLIEGIHFSITFYGGKVLAHFSCEDDPVADLIEIFRINQHAIVVIDRDGADENTRLNNTKQRVVHELGPEQCWVTQGREIENYLPTELVRRSLSQKHPAVDDITFGPDHRLNEVLEGMNNGPPRYDKVAFARIFAEAITETDLDILDLRDRLELVSKMIRQWNPTYPPTAEDDKIALTDPTGPKDE